MQIIEGACEGTIEGWPIEGVDVGEVEPGALVTGTQIPQLLGQFTITSACCWAV